MTTFEQLPTNWARVPFWSIFHRVKRSATGDEELLSVYRDHGVVRKSDRHDNFNKASDDLSLYQRLRRGDLVINKMKAWQGSVAISSHDGIVSPAYFVFEPIRPFDTSFMHHLLRSDIYIAAYKAASKGIRPNQWDLDPEVLRQIPVPLPSIDVQREISSFIDQETVQIDAFIADQEELIALLLERRTAAISHAVANGLDLNSSRLDTGNALFGQVPDGWLVHRLRYGIEFLTSGARGWAEYYSEQGAHFLRIGNLNRGTLEVKIEDIQRVKPPVGSEGSRAITQTGDVLFSITAYLGSVGVVPDSLSGSYVSQHVALVRPNLALFEPRYLGYLALGDAVQKQMVGGAYGGTKVQLALEDIADLLILRPPIQTQRQIVDYLDEEVRELDAAIGDARQAIALSRERRAALVSAAVTGKIDVRKHGRVA